MSIPVLSFFLLKDAEALRLSALDTLPERSRERARRLLEDLNTTLAAYIRAQLVACVLVGVLCGAGFAALGVPYAVLLGVLAAVRTIEDYVIYPRLMGKGIRLHPLAVILAVLAGIELGGVAGIFLAVPVLAAISVVWRHVCRWRTELRPVERPLRQLGEHDVRRDHRAQSHEVV